MNPPLDGMAPPAGGTAPPNQLLTAFGLGDAFEDSIPPFFFGRLTKRFREQFWAHLQTFDPPLTPHDIGWALHAEAGTVTRWQQYLDGSPATPHDVGWALHPDTGTVTEWQRYLDGSPVGQPISMDKMLNFLAIRDEDLELALIPTAAVAWAVMDTLWYIADTIRAHANPWPTPPVIHNHEVEFLIYVFRHTAYWTWENGENPVVQYADMMINSFMGRGNPQPEITPERLAELMGGWVIYWYLLVDALNVELDFPAP